MNKSKIIKFLSFLIFVFLLNFFVFVSLVMAQEEEGEVKAFNGKVVIYYFSDLNRENAQWAKEAAEYIWPLYKGVTGTEPEKIEVHISDFFHMSGRRSVQAFGMEEYRQGTCYIFLSNLDKKETQSTLSHEMFHCWQNAMGLKPYTENSWFWEASAVWAESWAYPQNNTEHRYLGEIFPYLNSYFFDSSRAREYGSYLFFYYLFQKNSFSPRKIIDLVKRLKTKNQVDVFSSDPSFYNSLKEYALWNWNKGVAKRYQDNPSFPNIYPSGPSLLLGEIRRNKKGESIFVPGGGIVYFVEKIDDNIDRLVFKLDKANKLQDTHLSLQALLNINGQWKYEDWSNLHKRRFCRHRKEEKVEKVVLIFANSKLKPEGEGSTLSAHLETDGTGECPRVWHGTTIITSHISSPLTNANSQLVLQEELKLIVNEYGDKCFAVTKQEVSFDNTEKTNMSCPFIGCSGAITQLVKETGTTIRYPPKNASFNDFICRFYQNKGESLKFNHSTEIYGDCDYVTQVKSSSFNCSCPGKAGSSSEHGSETQHGLCHSFFGLDVLGEIPVELENNGTMIKGKELGSTPGGARNVEIKWEYFKD